MTRYAVDLSVDGNEEQSSVVEANTALEAELEVVDHPDQHISGYKGEPVIIVDVREIWEE